MYKLLSYLNLIFKSNLFKNSSIYTLASFSNAVIPFLLLPILTQYLTTLDYGIITMFVTVVAFLLPLVGFNLDAAVTRRYYSKDTDLSIFLWNSLLIFFTMSLFCFILFYFFKDTIGFYTDIPENWVLMIPIVASATFLSNLALVLFQVREKPIKFATFQITQSILNVSLTAIFVIILLYDWTGRILSVIISTSIFSCISIFLILKNKDIKFIFNFSYIKNAISYGGGLIPHAIGGSLILLTNRFFLTKMVSIEESGLYGVANQICSIVPFITISFNNAYVPWLYKKLSLENEIEKIKIVKLTYTYFIAILIFVLIFYLTQPLLFNLFIGEEFHSAIQYSFWILIGFAFQGMYFMVTNYILYSEKTFTLAAITVVIGVLNIPLNYYLIDYYGELGAAISFAIIFFLYFIITWFISSKIFEMPWSIFKFKIK